MSQFRMEHAFTTKCGSNLFFQPFLEPVAKATLKSLLMSIQNAGVNFSAHLVYPDIGVRSANQTSVLCLTHLLFAVGIS